MVMDSVFCAGWSCGDHNSPAHFCPELARGLRGKMGVVTQLRPLPKGLPLDSLMLGAAFLA